MIEALQAWLATVLAWLSVPAHGLFSVFLTSLISGTLLALPTEAIVMTAVHAAPQEAWTLCAVAVLGNTLGGLVTWWMGYGARAALKRHEPSAWEARAAHWLKRWGARACLLTWVPIIGDPLCAAAGWLRLPFWSCLFYMTVGKALRYMVVVALALKLF